MLFLLHVSGPDSPKPWTKVQIRQVDVRLIQYSASSVQLLAVAKVYTTIFHLGERRKHFKPLPE